MAMMIPTVRSFYQIEDIEAIIPIEKKIQKRTAEINLKSSTDRKVHEKSYQILESISEYIYNSQLRGRQ